MTGNHFWKENQDAIEHVFVTNVGKPALTVFQYTFHEKGWCYEVEDVFVPIDARGRDGVYRWNTDKE